MVVVVMVMGEWGCVDCGLSVYASFWWHDVLLIPTSVGDAIDHFMIITYLVHTIFK